MDRKLIIAVPGPWQDRKELLTRIVESTQGAFMMAGMMLANPRAKDHIELELCEPDPNLRRAFEYAGQGRMKVETLDAIATHAQIAYLHFPLNVLGQQERLQRFTGLMRLVGGLAVKIESSGVAHEWDDWEGILTSEDAFDWYRGFVTLIRDEHHYYSCGMHHFDLPDAQVPRSLSGEAAADLLNPFNHYRILENPDLESGHTFSLAEDSPRYRLNLIADQRYPSDDLFHNEHGLWDLSPV